MKNREELDDTLLDDEIEEEYVRDRHAVNQERRVFKSEESDIGKRLDIFLQEKLGKETTRSFGAKLIDEGFVTVTGKSKIKSSYKLKGNEEIVVAFRESKVLDVVPENIPLNIIYEDRDIVIINKEPGVVVHPAHGNYSGTLVNGLMYHIKDLSSINGTIRPGIVHRLDKDTSGIIIIAKNDDAHSELSKMFKEKTMEKSYICICKGNFKEYSGRIENYIGRDPRDRKKMAVVEEGGKIAVSNYQVVDMVQNFSLVKVKIETGRTHQIRVHMKSLNRPIVGDSVYGNVNGNDSAKRQMLHAYNMKFKHPISGEFIDITAEIPEDFKAVAKRLGLDIEKV